MANVEEILQALFIGIAVASVLLQTCRYSKAIELFSECLVLLRKHSSKLTKDKLNKLHALLFHRLFKLNCLIGDYQDSIHWGEKAILAYHENGDNESEAALLNEIGDIYLSIGEQRKAKENYEKALAFYLTEVSKLKQRENFKETLVTSLVDLGHYSMALFEYDDAKEYLEQALTILKETNNEKEEGKDLQGTDEQSKLCALVYYRLFDLYCLVGDHKKAIESGEAFSMTSKYYDCGFERAAALFEKIGDLYQLTGEQVKAKERYQMALAFYSMMSMMFNLYGTPVIDKPKEHFNKMLVLATKTGDNEREGMLLNQLGELALTNFDYSKAKYYFQKELALSKETGNRKEEGRALRCLGNLYRKTEEYEQAKQYYEEAMILLEESGAIKDLGVACCQLGKVHSTLREFQKAKTLQMRALEMSVKTKDKDGEISDYRHLADAHTSLCEYDEAKECYQKALVISKETGDRKGEALTYSYQGFLYRELNDFTKAEDVWKKALEIFKEIDDLENEGSENRNLGHLYCFLGKCEEAIRCHERSLAITKQIGDRRGEGEAYCDLGAVYQSVGDYDKAKECHEQALAISKKTNHPRGQGVDYGNLGTVCHHLGDYNNAYEYFKKALEINIRTGNREGITAAYNHLGVVCQHRGEYVKAEKLCQKALANSKAIGDRKKEVGILCNLASIETSIGEHMKAKALYEEALQISKEVGDIRQEAGMNNSVGAAYQSLGDLTSAKKYLENSLAIMKRIGCKDGEGTVLSNLGMLCVSLGEYAKARGFYEEALVISRTSRDKKGEMTLNNNLGTLHLQQKELMKALDCFEKALEICEQTGDLHGKSTSCCHIAGVYIVCEDTPKALSYLSAGIKCLEKMRGSIGESEFHKIGFSDMNAAPYRLMISFLLKLECLNKALSVSELARARSLAELMANQYSCQQLPCFDPNQWNDFAKVIQTDFCTCLSFYFVGEHLFCWIVKAGKIEVVTNKGLTANARPQGTSVHDWLESLANEYNRTFLLLPEERCEDRSLFLWDEHTEARSPSKIKEESLPTFQGNGQGEKEEDKEPQALTEFYKIIITPVEKFLKGSELIIVPDRSLYRVPFAALKDESGEYLSEKFRIRFVPSLTTLKLIQDSPSDYHSQTGVLIVGDPEVGLPELCPPLPCAREEAEMIGQLLRVSPLTGKQSTKEAVLQRIHSVSLIHIAAHGNADRGDIALAPAHDVKGKPKMEDFVLTMSDISKVQLRAKLVVLSCCHSARGQIKAEGVVGIARAFLGSGARSVLVSLWAVDDTATMQFMKQFYGHLVHGKSASESLHETMKWMRGSPEYHEVRKWAPFMLIGDDVSFDFSK